MTRQELAAEAREIAAELLEDVGHVDALLYLAGLLIGASSWRAAWGCCRLIVAVLRH